MYEIKDMSLLFPNLVMDLSKLQEKQKQLQNEVMEKVLECARHILMQGEDYSYRYVLVRPKPIDEKEPIHVLEYEVLAVNREVALSSAALSGTVYGPF